MLYSSIHGGCKAMGMTKRSLPALTAATSLTARHTPHRSVPGTRTRCKGVKNG